MMVVTPFIPVFAFMLFSTSVLFLCGCAFFPLQIITERAQMHLLLGNTHFYKLYWEVPEPPKAFLFTVTNFTECHMYCKV